MDPRARGRLKAPRYLQIIDDFEHIGMTASSKMQKRQLTAYAEKLLTAERAS